MNHGGTRAARGLLALTLLFALALGSYDHTVNAEVSGTTYTSPHFGFSVTWQSPWYVTEDDTDDNGFDILGLADDQSIVYISGGHPSASSPAEVISDYAEQMGNSDDFSSLEPLDASECTVTPPADSAVACYLGAQEFSDGTQGQTGVFLQAWDLGDGLEVMLEAYVEQSQFAAYLAKWQTFGIYPPGQPVPTVTAGGCDATVENDINFCFDSNLPERDRDDITEAVRLGQDVIAQYFGNPDMSGVRINGFSSVSSDGDQSLATTLGHSIVVYAGSQVWQGVAPLERVQTLVHEFFHVYQNVMTEDSDAALPLWFTEGSAEAVGFLAVSQLGVSDQSEIYALEAYSLTHFPVSGSLADLQSSSSMGADAYPLAYVAIQYLLGSHGMSVSAIGDVYTELQQGATFDEAFQTVFGITVDQFYTDFDAWLPTFLDVDQMPQDFWPVDGPAQPAAVSIVAVPQEAERGQQIVAVGATLAGADCTADLTLGGSSLDRETLANGSGEVFWLLTIPRDAPVGPTTLTFSCGSAPATTQLTIS